MASAEVTEKTEIAVPSLGVFIVVRFLNDEMCNLRDSFVCRQPSEERQRSDTVLYG